MFQQRNRATTFRFQPRVEQVEERTVPAVIAVYDGITQTLTVTGDNGKNVIALGVNAAGQILLNGQTIPPGVPGGPTLANTAHVVVNGLDGEDEIHLSGLNGSVATPPLTVGLTRTTSPAVRDRTPSREGQVPTPSKEAPGPIRWSASQGPIASKAATATTSSRETRRPTS